MNDSTRSANNGQGTPRPQRAAVLCTRVSSKDQLRGGFSIPAQRKLLADYARARGFAIAAEFSDVETAGRAGRTQFGTMITHVRDHADCTAILVEKTDRLYRNIKDWVTLSDLGVDVHLVKEGVVLSDDAVPAVTFVHGIKVLMAKNYLDNLSEETRKGIHEKARQGLWPSRAPFGYTNVTRSDGKRIIVPDPEAAPLIARLFELYATGDYPITRLTDEARRLGLVYRKSGKPLPRAQIHVMLRNPVYMGEFDWKGARYRGAHEPLVCRALWKSVQALLGSRAPRRRVRQRHEFAFSRLVHCGRCWDEGRRFLLVAERQKGRCVYYRCEECKRRRRADFVREERLLEAFSGALATLPTDATTLEAARTALGRNAPVAHDVDNTRLRAEHSSLQARLDTAYDDRVSGRIDAAYFDRRAAEWRARMHDIEAALAEPDITDSTDSEAALELAEVMSIFRETDGPLVRRRLIAALHSNSLWLDGALHVEWRQPADVLDECGRA